LRVSLPGGASGVLLALSASLRASMSAPVPQKRAAEEEAADDVEEAGEEGEEAQRNGAARRTARRTTKSKDGAQQTPRVAGQTRRRDAATALPLRGLRAAGAACRSRAAASGAAHARVVCTALQPPSGQARADDAAACLAAAAQTKPC
jgi:hypothetical protein